MDCEYENSECPICQTTRGKQIAKKGQFGLPVHVFICKSCGLVFLNPRWREEIYHEFYRNEYDNYYRQFLATPNSGSFDETIPKRINTKIIRHLRLNNDTKCLDIGCGTGTTLNYFKRKHNCSVYGIESSEKCIRTCLDDSNIQLIATNVADEWEVVNENRFEVIIMRHVLEHFLKPIEVLQKARRSLADKGIIYVEVPDMLRPRGSLKGYWFRVVHTYYFSLYTLSTLCNLSGLNILESGKENSCIWVILSKNQDNLITHPVRGSNNETNNHCKVYFNYYLQLLIIRVHQLIDVARSIKNEIKKRFGKGRSS